MQRYEPALRCRTAHSSGTCRERAYSRSAASVDAFIDSLTLPLEEPLIKAPPRTRRSWVVDDDWIPRRSDRSAAKSAFRDPQPEKQAQRVLLNKWAGRPNHVVTNTPDSTIVVRFHEAFSDDVPSSRREVVHKFFPLLGVRFAGTIAGEELEGFVTEFGHTAKHIGKFGRKGTTECSTAILVEEKIREETQSWCIA